MSRTDKRDRYWRKLHEERVKAMPGAEVPPGYDVRTEDGGWMFFADRASYLDHVRRQDKAETRRYIRAVMAMATAGALIILAALMLALCGCSSHQSSTIRATAQDSITVETVAQESARTDELIQAVTKADSVVVTRSMEREGTHVRAVIYNPVTGVERATTAESTALLGSRVEAGHAEQCENRSENQSDMGKPPTLLVILLCISVFALWVMANELLTKSAKKMQ